MPTKSQPVMHRRHSIKTMKSGAGWQARAFRGTAAAGGVVTATTEESAILAIKRQLDEAAAERQALRAGDGFPTIDEVRAAWPHLKFNKAQDAMLAAHLNAPDHVLTATQLAQAAGYDDYVVTNSQYGQLGRALADELDWQPPTRKDGNPIWTLTLATSADDVARDEGDETAEHWRWKLRAEIVAVLSRG
jgi:hypothetical protein